MWEPGNEAKLCEQKGGAGLIMVVVHGHDTYSLVMLHGIQMQGHTALS